MAIYENYDTIVYENLRQMYHAAAQQHGEKILFLERRKGEYRGVSFADYAADVDALGTALCARGLHGKPILLLGENCYSWVTAYMAVICGVGVIVPVDKKLPASKITEIARLCDAGAVIYSSRYARKLRGLDRNVKRIAFEELKALIGLGRGLLEKGNRCYLDSVIDANAMSALLFTSGTEGAPKGVMLSHRNLCFDLSEMCRMIYIDEKDVFLSILPLHHAYECTCGFLCAVYRGCTLAFSRGLRHLSAELREVRPTLLLCVPLLLETFYRRVWENLCNKGLKGRVKKIIDLTNALPTEELRISAKRRLLAPIHRVFGGRLRMLISGGAGADPAALKGLRDLGILAFQGYGLTECSPLAALNRDRYYNDRSAGLATPNALLDIDDRRQDGIGEVRCKGDHVMLGYYGQPEATARVLRNGWFYTGDLGYMDENGFLFLVGRRQNLIFVGGKPVSPEVLEEQLCRTPYIKEAVVVGYPKGEDSGNCDLVALLYPDRERLAQALGEEPSPERLDAEMKRAVGRVNGSILPHQRITAFLLWEEEFPKNTTQKILRAGLARRAHPAYLQKKGG